MKLRGYLGILMPFIAAALLRTYPFFKTGAPFHVDTWPLIRITKELLELTPIPLKGGPPFDFYNIYWPATSLYCATMSVVTGLGAISASSIYVPLAAATATPIFYIIALRITSERRVAFLSSLLLATSGIHCIMTAGAVKEGYANPLYLTIIYIFIRAERVEKKWVIPLILCFVTLVMAHHLTTLVLLLSISSMFVLGSAVEFRERGSLRMKEATIILACIAIAAIYYLTYAIRGFQYDITLSRVISIASYQIIMILLSLRALFTSSRENFLGVFAFLALASGFLALSKVRRVLPGAPLLPTREIMMLSPYVLVALLAVLGYRFARNSLPLSKFAIAIAWLASLIGLEGYALFGERILALSYRLINFLYKPVILFATITFAWLRRKRIRRPLLIIASILTIFLAASTAIPFYAVVSLKDRYLGAQGDFSRADMTFLGWAERFLPSKEVIAGDQRVNYMMKYIEREVNVLDGFLFLNEIKHDLNSGLLVTYREMRVNGYYLVYHGEDLSAAWEENLKASGLFRVYDNSVNQVYKVPSPNG